MKTISFTVASEKATKFEKILPIFWRLLNFVALSEYLNFTEGT